MKLNEIAFSHAFSIYDSPYIRSKEDLRREKARKKLKVQDLPKKLDTARWITRATKPPRMGGTFSPY